MKEVSFKFGSRAKGWKYYICTDEESKWDKEREHLYGLGGNMCYFTYPDSNINIGRKHPINIKDSPMGGMDYTKVNFEKLCKKLKDVTKYMKEENFGDITEKITFYWELAISDYTIIPTPSYKHINKFKMWRGTNYEPIGLQEIKDCFANYFKNR